MSLVSAALASGATFAPERLREPHEAIAAYLRAVDIAAPQSQCVDIAAAAGRLLSRDIVSASAHPVRATATMDGFALRAAGPRVRRIASEAGLGSVPARSIAAGQAMRVAARGVLPEGADTVAPLEDVDVRGDEVALRLPVCAGDCVTAAGADIRAGETLLEAGRRIGGAELAVLATLGIVDVPVYRRPVVAIVSTGGEPKRHAIAAILSALGCRPVHLGSADDASALRAALGLALASADAVAVVGGTSVGERDLTARVIDGFGNPGVVVHGLRVKPGKPTVFGGAAGKPVIGLPGNPVSALMIADAVAGPLFRRLTGALPCAIPAYDAVATVDFVGRDGWTWYVPAVLEETERGLSAKPLSLTSSHASLLARAHGYVVLGETHSRIEAGTSVRVVPFAAGGRSAAPRSR
jgi:molybdopterin biosynthesis enzyme